MNIVHPIKNAAYRVVTSGFGMRIDPLNRYGDGKSFHNGTDYATPIGSELLAPFDGEISGIYNNDVGGNQLILTADNGYTYGFAHLQDYNVVKNQRVKKGDLIAFSGNSGPTTGPHLHFTVRDASSDYVDPEKHLSEYLDPSDPTVTDVTDVLADNTSDFGVTDDVTTTKSVITANAISNPLLVLVMGMAALSGITAPLIASDDDDENEKDGGVGNLII